MHQNLMQLKFLGVVFIAVTCILFALLKWPLAILSLAGLNISALVGFLIARKRMGAGLAGSTALLLVLTLLFTDWGLSTPNPSVQIAWSYLITACISEIMLLTYWLCYDPEQKVKKSSPMENDIPK
jgi:hypothetical protein